MSFPFFPLLCAFMALLPVVLSLNGLGAPEALQSTPISLHGNGQSGPGPDCPGALLAGYTLQGSVKVITKDGTVYDIAFDYTCPSGRGCIPALPEGIRNCLGLPAPANPDGGSEQTASRLTPGSGGGAPTAAPAGMTMDISNESSITPSHTLGNGQSTESYFGVMQTASSESGGSTTLTAATMMDIPNGSLIPSSPASETTPPSKSTTKAISTEAIVGIAVGAFALLLSVLLALFIWRLRSRQKARESAPSRAFWRSLDKKNIPGV
ncbi:hypothetical protein IW261DRAFT_1568462 [Armillaria novae-zelandiae]|uniref:Mid2 domain-containing protein n=1 Tax=Armillaria novae-zelandiae TaxID=153914 RepID=A0AA39UDS0_9AGAR|nr:hypothetical protein IW261DRAFT_1568462 [Armillaria novae-zelandiae]